MLGCMNVHPRGEANAAAVIRISGHRKGAVCRSCAEDIAFALRNVGAGSRSTAVIGEVQIEPIPLTKES